MSDSKPLNDWIKDFEALQRQYLGAWSDLMQKTPGGVPPPAPFSNPFAAAPGMFGAGFGAPSAPATPNWQEGFEQWSRTFGAKGGAGDTMQRMIESSKAYIGMIKMMLGGAAAADAGDASNPGQAWLDALRAGMPGMPGFQMPGGDGVRGFQTPGQDPSAFKMPGFDTMSGNPFFKALRDMAGPGAKGLGDLPAAFAPFLEQLRQQNMSLLHMPAFGLAREHQEHYQRTALAFVAYQEALRGYNALLLKASQRGLELMEGKLAERSEPGRTIDSPRALYDLWVDAAEEGYAEIALSDEFGKAYGELANAQMRMRAQIQAEVERIGTDLGMPTRSELDSVHQRLHDLRREFRDSRHGSATIAELEAEVAVLRTEVERLSSGQETLRLDVNAATVGRAAARPTASAPATPGPAKVLPRRRAGKSGRAAADVTRASAKSSRDAGKPAAVAAKRAARDTSRRTSPAANKPASQPAPAAPPAPARAPSKAAKPSTGKSNDAVPASARPSRKAKRSRPQRRARAKAPPVKAAFAKPVPAKSPSAPAPAPASFGDAIAAMRKRVARSTTSGRMKSVAAQFAGPYRTASSKIDGARKSKRRSKS